MTTLFVTLEAQECCNCGIIFGMTKETTDRFRENHNSFYCPAGHPQHYIGKTEAQKLKDELAREKQRAEQREADLKQRLEWRDKEIIAKKSQLTKLRNRVANGVCPCCTRSFSNVQRHIEHMHPEYKGATKSK